MTDILLVEDHRDLADGLQQNFEVEGYRVRVAARAAEALALAAVQAPGLVVLDLGLPDRDGFHVLRELRERGCNCPVLILSARELVEDKVEGFRLGADDYVTKPFGVLELLARVAALLRRATPPPPTAPAITPTGGETTATDLPDGALRERFGLTARQLVVARLLGEGLSNAEIAERLCVSAFTARNHTEQVLAKLGVSSRARVGAIVRGAA